jgi:hypothetical protein
VSLDIEISDASRSHVSLADFNAPNDGSANARTALQAALLAARDRGLGLIVPKGTYRIDSRLDTIDYVASVQGLGGSNTGAYLLKNYADGTPDRGMFSFRPGSDGSRLAGFYMKNVGTGGCLIEAKATSGATMTNLVFEDLNLSLDDATPPDHYIHLDGTAKTANPKGCRLICMRNIMFFGSTLGGVIIRGVNGLWWHGGGGYPAGSSSIYSGSVAISGTSTVQSSGIVIELQTVNCWIITQTNGARLTSQSVGVPSTGFSVEADSTVTNAKIFGSLSGAVNSNGWISSATYP